MSNVYRGVPNSNGDIKHWKYIKRVRKNGKWVYYYDQESLKKDVAKTVDNIKDKIGFDEKEAYDKARQEAETSKAVAILSQQEEKRRKNQAYEDRIVTKKEKVDIEEIEKVRKKNVDQYVKDGEKFVAAEKAYMKTPLYKLEKASEAVSNFIRNLFGIKPKKATLDTGNAVLNYTKYRR